MIQHVITIICLQFGWLIQLFINKKDSALMWPVAASSPRVINHLWSVLDAHFHCCKQVFSVTFHSQGKKGEVVMFLHFSSVT